MLDSSTNGTTITTCQGTLYDSGINSNYSDFENYSITICSDAGQAIELDFSFFDVEYHWNCWYDVLAIYDGTSTNASLIGYYCGSSLPPNIVSTNDCLHITFFSDYIINEGGWSAEISCSSTDEICNNGIDDDGDGSTDEFCNTCPTGSIDYERWTGISGSAISNLTNNSNYPDNPNIEGVLNSFQGPVNIGNNYGTRARGYLKPTETGFYQFTVTSDDASEFYLSSDGDPTNMTQIASVPGWTQINQFNKYAQQNSASIFLYAGANYYVEMLHKEGGGGDHFQVYWTTPSNSTRTIIPGSFLSPLECCSVDAGIDQTICEGSSTTLNTTPVGSGAISYSWSPTTGLSNPSIQNPVASPVTTTTYTVSITDGSGCISTDDVQITVNNGPSINITDETICFGETSAVTPTATGAAPFTFDWGGATVSGNTLTVFPSTTTSYIVTVTDNNNCTNTATTTITIDNSCPPTVEICNNGIDDDGDGSTDEFCNTCPTGSIDYERWTGISGSFITDLTNSANYPASPDDVGTFNSFQGPVNIADNYGTRVRGYLKPTETGFYQFTVTSDDATELYLSLDGGPNNMTQIASVPGWTQINEFNKYAQQNSTSIFLYAGAHYYVEMLHKEGGGGDHLQVYWTTPSNSTRTIIPGSFLSPVECCSVDAGIDQTICEGSSITLNTTPDGSGVISYNWSPTTGLSNSSIQNPVASPTSTTTYTVSITDATGCISTDEVQVTVMSGPSINLSNEDICLGESSSVTPTATGAAPFTYDWGGANVSGNTLTVSPSITTSYIVTVTDNNNCTSTAATTITVDPVPSVGLNLADIEYCIDETNPTLSGGTPSGGVYSGNGVSGGVLNLSSAGLNTHTITYTFTDSNGCTNSASQLININGVPTVNLNLDVDEVCISESSIILSGGSPAGGTYSSPYATGTTFDVTAAGIGLHTIVYSYTDGNGCINTANDQIEIYELPLVELNLTSTDHCIAETTFALSGGTPTGGTYSGPGVTGTNFNPNIAGVDTHTITYTYSDSNGCENTVTEAVTVHELPTVTFDINQKEICLNSASIALSGGLPLGGTYTGIGVSSNSFSPLTAGLGTHIISYTYQDAFACEASMTQEIEVLPLPVVSIDIAENEFCLDDDPLVLSGESPLGGIYSGPGVSAGVFDPGVAGAGTHTIRYTFTGVNGCFNIATEDVIVYDLPNVVLDFVDSEQCVTSEEFALNEGVPAGGMYAGLGVTGTNFDASSVGLGTYEIIYTYTNSNGCVSQDSDFIVVSNSTELTFDLIDDVVCEEETVVNLSGASPSGGTYSGPGVTANVFNANEVGVGFYTITYTYNDGVCVNIITDEIEVIATPEVSLTLGVEDACFEEENIILSGGSPSGGSYTGVGVTAGVFNTYDSGVGQFEITYSFTAANGCTGTATQYFTVHDYPTVGLSLTDDEACVIETTHVLDGASPLGGVFSGPGVTGTNFNPLSAGAGDHEIEYTFTDSFGCINTATDIISVVDIPDPSLELPVETLCEGETLSLSGGMPGGGSWSGPGVVGDQFDASAAGPGTHTISYNFTVSECFSSITDEIIVYAMPSVTTSFSQTSFCYGGLYLLSGESPTGGNWSGPGVTGSVFDAAVAGEGMHDITYSYTSSDGCTNSSITTVTVFEETPVTLVLSNDEDCIDNTTLLLDGATPTGGMWFGPGVTGNNFDASTAGLGLHSIFYSYTDSNGCTNEVSDQILVNDLPDVSLSLTTENACPGTGPITLSGGWPLGGVYSGPGVVGNTIDLGLAGEGIHTITYTVTNNGCSNATTDQFEIFSAYNETFELDEDGICLGYDFSLSGNAPAGGQYQGPGVDPWSGNFSSVIAGVGTHIIYYNFIDVNGCEVQLSDQLTVYDVPPASLTLDTDRVCATENSVLLTGGTPSGGTFSGPGVTGNVFNPLSVGAGTYTITYSYADSNGCMAEAIDEIIVDPIPSVTYTYEDDHCDQNSASISFVFQDQQDITNIQFSINGGISWRPLVEDALGGITYSNLSAGNYTLLVRNEGGTCESEIGQIVIDNIGGPTADAGPDVTISVLGSTALNGSGGSFYLWTPSTGLSNTNIASPTASPTSTTTYILQVTDIYGCTDTDEVTVTVESICAGTITDGDYPYFESFETGLGLWSQEPSLDNFDWERDNGSASHGSWFMLADENNTTNQTAIFKSPCFDLEDQSCAQFTFDYYLANSGTLSLEATNEFGQNWYTLWSISGNQGSNWRTQIIDLFAYLNTDIQLRFVAEMGPNSGGSMGIDNMEFITTGCGCEDTSSPFLNFDLVSDPMPFSVDIDCDGDADMLSGGDGQLFFFENNGDGTYTDQTGTAQDIMPNLNFLDMTLGLVDLDNDGDKDLSIVGNEPYNKYFFWNTGTKTDPIFTSAGTGGTPANPISGFDFGPIDGGFFIGYADPTIFWADLDNDDDFDAVIGGKLGWFLYYENIGDENTPNLVVRTGAANPFNGLRVDGADEGNGLIQYESSPLLIDWDGDGDLDLFSGNQISTVQYFENIGSASNPNFVERTGSANPFDGVIFSEDSHLSIIDEDCDGDWDVFYGVGDSSLDAEITMCDLLVAVPNFAQANASQSHFCYGESIFLFEESTVGVTWNWTGPNGFTSNDQDPVINGAADAMAGTYTVTITNEQGCQFTSSIEISISGSTANAGPDATIDLGDSTQNVGSGDGQTYIWSPTAGLSNPNILNPIVSPSSTTTYTLTVIDELGCTSTDQMTVYVTSDECTYGNQIFLSDFENTSGDNFWTIGNNATDGNFVIGVPSPYTQSSTTVMEIVPQEGDQSMITGNATNYTQDLDGGPSTARSINITLPNDANSIDISLYWYLSHYINGDNQDYLTIDIRDASNGSVLETLVDVQGSSTDRDAEWALASLDLSAHAGKTIYIFVQAADAGNGSKLEVGIDNVSIYGTFSTVADINLTVVDFCSEDSQLILSGGTPAGGVYTGPGVTGNIFDPAVAGPGIHTISYEYSDVAGCIATAVEGIEVYEPPTIELSIAVDTVCVNQAAVGLFGGLPTGGVWSGVSVVGSTFYPGIAGVGPHDITYTVTDANGCTNSITAELFVLTVPIITEVSSTDAFCNLENGTITISFDDVADIDNIEFSLNGGFTWESAIPDTDGSVSYGNLDNGTYDLWVRNSNGNCPYQLQTVEILDIMAPLVDVGTDINMCFGDTETINPIVEFGTVPYSYLWSGPNGFTATDESINVLDAGVYTLVVTDDNDCTTSDELIVNHFSLSVEAAITPIECYGDDGGRIIASANGTPPYTYTLVGEGTNGSGVFNNLIAGNYELEVEDGYGCTFTQGFNVPGPPPLSCSQDSCVRANNLAWTGVSNGPWVSSVGTTNVSLSVTNDANTDVSIFAINETITNSNPAWFTEAGAGLPALSLTTVWDSAPENEMTDIDVATDDKGSMTFTFNFNEAVQDFVLHVDKLGEFGYNGSLARSNSSVWSLSTAGVTLYKLSGTSDFEVNNNSFYRTKDVEHDMTEDAAALSTTGSAAGSIAVYSASAISSISFTVTGIGVEGMGYDQLRLAISSSVCSSTETSPYSCDDAPGVATISAHGGVHPYTYAWDNGETTQTAINLTGGTHTVTITDSNGCIQVCSVIIEENNVIVDAGFNSSFCEGDSDILSPTVSGGAEPYSFLWSGPNGFESADENPTVTEGGSYTLLVTDDNGCTSTDVLTVYSYLCNQTSNCYYLDEFNNFSYFGSNGTLNWANDGWDEIGDNNAAISGVIQILNGGLQIQNYDATNPSIQRSANLGGHSSAVLSFDYSTEGDVGSNSIFNVQVYDGSDWVTVFTNIGSLVGVQTPWLDISDHISPDFEVKFSIVSGFYDNSKKLILDNVRIDLDCLCEDNANAGIDLEICEGDSIQIMGQGNGDFLWSPAGLLSDATIEDPIAFPTVTTTFELVVTDEFGCEDTSEVTVTVNQSVDAEAEQLAADACYEDAGSVSVIIHEGTAPFTISWENVNGGQAGTTTSTSTGTTVIPGLSGGQTYCIQILDANGCTINSP